MYIKNIFILLSIIYTCNIYSQNDNKTSKNSRFFPKIKGYYIAIDNQKKFDNFEFWNGKEFLNVEGRQHIIRYSIRNSSKPKTEKEITNFYKKIIKRKKGKFLYFGKYPKKVNYNISTYKITRKDKEIWLQVVVLNGGNDYEIYEIYGNIAQNVILSSQLMKEINESGEVALYLNFDRNKHFVKSESISALKQVEQLLKENPKLKIYIEGHTDNTGSPRKNKTLSRKRANFVKKGLVEKGINSRRLKVVGYGQEKPIGNNSTKEGRAKNRRVVLRKM